MATGKRPSLAAVINGLTVLRPRGRDEVVAGFLDALELVVKADAFALLGVNGLGESVRILGGRGLRTAPETWGDPLEVRHLIEQAAQLHEKPAMAAAGSFDLDPFLALEEARFLAISRLPEGEDELVTLAIRRGGDQFSGHETERFGAIAGVINLLGRSFFMEKEGTRGPDRDALTGLGQFSTFHDSLVKELSRARRGAGTLTIGILSIVKGEGAPLSEEELLAVSGVLGNQLRNFDTLVRYSPTEFAFLLADLKAPEGVKVMERVMIEIEDALGGFPDPSWTCVGLAGYPDDAASVERLIEMAEAAANQVKESGNPGVTRWKG